MHHSLAITQLFRILAILAAMQITSASLNAGKSSAKSSPSPPAAGDNPLLVESTLPYHAPSFDKIKDEHFVPAIEAGMREELKEVDAIAANSEKPTFNNTIVALERSGRLLDRAERTFSNLNAADTNPTRQKIDTETAPKLSAHRDTIFLNGKLFARIQELYFNRDKLGLDPESAYLLERYYKDFVRATKRN
jgi:peptidyl-dipeptidase Dcp